ncbi:basic salivary proline-rich protein 2-like [Eschrichtius robustus]|uniref:basic salivary proline-rich protein 2-like n=1 Tax=Eschrichtius robustus TaxID=9764 RepID=UPI0035BF0294
MGYEPPGLCWNQTRQEVPAVTQPWFWGGSPPGGQPCTSPMGLPGEGPGGLLLPSGSAHGHSLRPRPELAGGGLCSGCPLRAGGLSDGSPCSPGRERGRDEPHRHPQAPGARPSAPEGLRQQVNQGSAVFSGKEHGSAVPAQALRDPLGERGGSEGPGPACEPPTGQFLVMGAAAAWGGEGDPLTKNSHFRGRPLGARRTRCPAPGIAAVLGTIQAPPAELSARPPHPCPTVQFLGCEGQLSRRGPRSRGPGARAAGVCPSAGRVNAPREPGAGRAGDGDKDGEPRGVCGGVCGLAAPLQQMFQACKTKAERLPLPGENPQDSLRGSATKDAAPPPPPPNPLTPARSRRPRAPPDARGPLLGHPRPRSRDRRRREQGRGALPATRRRRGGRRAPPFCPRWDPGGCAPPAPIIHLPDSRCSRPRKSAE